MHTPIGPQTLIFERYLIHQMLGPSEFGWVYLATDAQRPEHLLVLEEFIPQLNTPELLADLRQALTQRLLPLTQLNHPQIGQGYWLVADRGRLYWVRDYVDGDSVRTLLAHHGGPFSEPVVMAWLVLVLKVLDWLHDRHIAHQNLNLDTILLRASDDLPVLVNFGMVRSAALALGLAPLTGVAASGLGRWLSAADTGIESAIAQDLQDLAGVALAMLSGEPIPVEGLQGILSQIDPALARILKSMLGHRGPTAAAVIERLQSQLERRHAAPIGGGSGDKLDASSAVLQAWPWMSNWAPEPDFDEGEPTPIGAHQPATSQTPSFWKDLPSLVLTGLALVAMTLLIWKVRQNLPIPPTSTRTVPMSAAQSASQSASQSAPMLADRSPDQPANAAQTVPGEQASQDAAQKVGVSAALFASLVNESFGTPPPPSSPEWQQAAHQLGTRLSQLSADARSGVGQYYRRDYDRWLNEIADLNLTSPAVDLMTDTNFLMTFPDRRGKQLNPRGFGQVWYAIARDQIAALRQQQTLKRLTTLRGVLSDRLSAKQGQIYQMELQSNQKFKLRLKVTAGDPRLSVFSKEMALVRLTADREWSITALAPSRYDIVITPSSDDAVKYQLQLES